MGNEGNIVKMAMEYAFRCHGETNHLYDGKPYTVHLDDVFYVGLKFIYLVDGGSQQDVLAALWCHDVIEDTRQTYNEVLIETNKRVADLVYAVTNEKGKSRAERASDKYYAGIVGCEYGVFVKLCDRIANVEYSKRNGGGMFEKYKKENRNFLIRLGMYSEEYDCNINTRYLAMCVYLGDVLASAEGGGEK